MDNVIWSCPECRADKCINCDGMTWDFDSDEYVICPCFANGHRRG